MIGGAERAPGEAVSVKMQAPLSCKVMAHDRPRVSGIEAPRGVQHAPFVHSHSHVLAKMFRPCRDDVFQPENTRPLEAFVKPAVECSIASHDCLNFLHQGSELLSIFAFDGILDGYSDWSVLLVRGGWKLVQRVEGGRINESPLS